MWNRLVSFLIACTARVEIQVRASTNTRYNFVQANFLTRLDYLVIIDTVWNNAIVSSIGVTSTQRNERRIELFVAARLWIRWNSTYNHQTTLIIGKSKTKNDITTFYLSVSNLGKKLLRDMRVIFFVLVDISFRLWYQYPLCNYLYTSDRQLL